MSKTTTNDGFSTGLKVWMLFLLTFALLGYSVVLSIFFGALAGLAAGVIAWGFQSKDTPEGKTGEQPPGQESVSARLLRDRFSQFRLGVGNPQNQDQRQSGFRPRLFGRKRRSPRTRR
ncbi:MAG: hypothetical protein HC879_11935 [Leptolyngbyaceae cyanobacterium SL_5_9]|nr:hypothetical protein [Leptolyngbyaceae cyanobacterium SM1_4_3]NJN58142.1 hypothetical protein [Leptolyngbyaceae cyanobacterium SL_5_9]NJO67002.1 hypothetical protein [Leptolyngbyaceae cyanobacterium RM1_405_57]